MARRGRAKKIASTPLCVSEDPAFTLGVGSSASVEILPAEKFPGWKMDGRSQMKFDGAGGVASLDRTEVARVYLAVTSDRDLGRAPVVELMRYVEIHFQIPESIPTPRVVVMTKRETLYVHKMHRYLTGVADDISEPLFVHSTYW